MSSPLQAAQPESVPRYAQVALPVHLRKLFTYRLPPSMQHTARPGARVIVRLGTKPMTGYIVALLPTPTGTSLVESELKEVEKLLDVEPSLTPEVLEITRWVADYYAVPLGEVMRAALPAGINTSIMQVVSITPKGLEMSVPPASAGGLGKVDTKTRALQILAEGEVELNAFNLRMGAAQTPKWLRELEREGLIVRHYRARSTETRAKHRRAVRLLESEHGYAGVPPAPVETKLSPEERPGRVRTERVTAAQKRAIETLRANQNEMAVGNLVDAADVSESVIATLKKKGVVEEFEQDVRRDPLALAELPDAEEYKLTSAQSAALGTITEAMDEHRFAPFLLHGITGSGKTEVYIRAMRAALESERGAMMLVPEIALTPILSRRLRAHFGDQIAIFHSSLSKGERFDEWTRLRTGEARVVLGTRSAVFAPVDKLGLINRRRAGRIVPAGRVAVL